MPLLPLPVGGSGLAGGDLPVSDADDVLKEFDDVHRAPEVAPIRDAFVEAFAVGNITYQDLAEYAIAQCDPLRATGEYLAGLAAEREVPPAQGESEESLRARLFAAPSIVTPDAIAAAVNAILAKHTTKECEVVELELDGWYVHDGTVTAWDSFIGASPRYPDRLFPDDATENGGDFVKNSDPGGAIPARGLVRSFHIRLPVIDAADEDFAFAIDATDAIMAIGDGSDTAGAESDGSVATSVFVDSRTVEEAFAAIVGAVESIKGQGMSWSAYVDPNL